MSTKNSSPLYDETNAFWEINLKGSLMEMVAQARNVAEDDIQTGLAYLERLQGQESIAARLQALIQTAQAELSQGDLHQPQSNDVYAWARALRAFTRAQVRARQVINTLTFYPKHRHTQQCRRLTQIVSP